MFHLEDISEEQWKIILLRRATAMIRGFSRYEEELYLRDGPVATLQEEAEELKAAVDMLLNPIKSEDLDGIVVDYTKDDEECSDIDKVYDEVDNLANEEKWDEIDNILSSVDCYYTPISVLIAYLTITSNFKNKLKCRDYFYSIVRDILELEGDNPDEVLHGLE